MLVFLFLHACGVDEVCYQQYVGSQGAELGERVGEPLGVDEVDATELEQGAHHAHQGTTGYESAGYERALLATCLVHLLVLAAGGDIPVHGSAHQ